MICLVRWIFEIMEKVEGEIGEKMGEKGVWLGREKEGRKW